jgi:Cyclophilin-like
MANTTADAVAHYLWQQNYRLNYTRAHRDKLRALQHSSAAELNTKYILNIRFDFGSVTLDAEFLDTSAATVIKASLPINATVVTWDGGLYFQIGTRVTRLSGARTEVALGEIAYCPDTGPSPSPSDASRCPPTPRRGRNVPATFGQERSAT